MESYKKKITHFYKTHRRLPSYAEIAVLLGFRSKNAAYKLAQKLIDLKFISKDKEGKLIPQNIFGDLRLLGLVEAGFPSPAEEELADTMSLDEYLIPNKEASYMLKVKGDSMKNAGICEGDMVIVERTNSPKAGDIVIAEVDGAWTMKYLRKRGTHIYLEAANEKYKPLVPKNDLKIAAVVRAVVRKY
ncbi:MAG TPA: transcriptional repressor LexA [Candidatus Paceibacterota bacterium]